jgi:hypothetical protein
MEGGFKDGQSQHVKTGIGIFFTVKQGIGVWSLILRNWNFTEFSLTL